MLGREQLEEILKAVPEDVVDRARINNKQAGVAQENIRNLFAGDFWKFKYTERHIYKYTPNIITSLSEDLNSLHSFFDEEYFELREILNAITCKECNGKFAYKLENLTTQEYASAYRLLLFSLIYGYYFWDIQNACSSSDILAFYEKYISMPTPPLPYSNCKEQESRVILYNLIMGRVYVGSRELVDECKRIEFTYKNEAPHDTSNTIENLKQIQLDYKKFCLALDVMINGDPKDEDEIEQFISDRKNDVADGYHLNSNAARIIGIILYEQMQNEKLDYTETVKHFINDEKYAPIKNIELFTNSSNKCAGDKDNTTLKRWLKITEQCIDLMSVLAFK